MYKIYYPIEYKYRMGSPLLYLQTLGPDQDTQSSSWSKAVTQLQPVLVGLGDFAALTAWIMGMNGKVAAVLWGSI